MVNVAMMPRELKVSLLAAGHCNGTVIMLDSHAMEQSSVKRVHFSSQQGIIAMLSPVMSCTTMVSLESCPEL